MASDASASTSRTDVPRRPLTHKTWWCLGPLNISIDGEHILRSERKRDRKSKSKETQQSPKCEILVVSLPRTILAIHCVEPCSGISKHIVWKELSSKVTTWTNHYLGWVRYPSNIASAPQNLYAGKGKISIFVIIRGDESIEKETKEYQRCRQAFTSPEENVFAASLRNYPITSINNSNPQAAVYIKMRLVGSTLKPWSTDRFSAFSMEKTNDRLRPWYTTMDNKTKHTDWDNLRLRLTINHHGWFI